jgi:hypothetical protein
VTSPSLKGIFFRVTKIHFHVVLINFRVTLTRSFCVRVRFRFIRIPPLGTRYRPAVSVLKAPREQWNATRRNADGTQLGGDAKGTLI